MPESNPKIKDEIFGIYTCFAVTIAGFISKNIPQNA
jgi:hypothetical protein